MNDYLFDIQSFVQNLTTKTENGSIPWRKANPTTFYWIKEVASGKIRTLIQRAAGPNRVYFRLEVTDIETEEEITSIDTRELDEIEFVIENLYQAAESIIFRQQGKREEVFRELLET